MSAPAPTTRETRHDLLVLLVGAALLFLLRLGARDLWNPNEPLYGRAVVEMSRSGDWLVPTFNGEVFDEKPILYFWAALAASRVLGGVDELSLRVPSAVSGLVGVGLVYLLAASYAGRRRGILSAAAFATIHGVFWSARAVQMDLLVTVTTLGTVLALTRVIDQGAPAVRGWAVAGAWTGLGFLAKGPVGLICPLLAVGSHAVDRRSLGATGPRHAVVCVSVFVAVAAPWFLWLAARGEWAFLHEMLVRQNVTRFLSPWDHQRPWWYYLLYLWIDMAPWAFLLPLAWRLPGRTRDERRLDRLAWLWIAATVVFFSLSASKRSSYILPVAPAVAILAAAPVERLILGSLGRARRRWLLGLVTVAGISAAAAGWYVARHALPQYPELTAPGRALTILLAGGGLVTVAALAAARRRPLAAPSALAALVISLYVLAAAWVLPAADAYKSARPFCRKLDALVPHDRPLRSYRFWRWRASYVYYSDRVIESIDSPEELVRFWGRPEQVFVLVERDRVDEVRRVLGVEGPWFGQRIGGNSIHVFTNR